MKLRSSEAALYGQPINVSGTVYVIRSDGVIDNVLPEHAQRLLQIRGYRMLEGEMASASAEALEVVPVEEAPESAAAKRLAALKAMSARALMQLGRKYGLKVIGKTSDELAHDILGCEIKYTDEVKAAQAEKADESAES